MTTPEPSTVVTMEQSNHCVNEDRIVKLEASAEHRADQLKQFQKRLEKLDESIDRLCLNVAEVNSILSTLKWIIGISIALFGGIFTAIAVELLL